MNQTCWPAVFVNNTGKLLSKGTVCWISRSLMAVFCNIFTVKAFSDKNDFVNQTCWSAVFVNNTEKLLSKGTVLAM